MEKRDREKDLGLIRHYEKYPPKSLVSRYTYHHLKKKHGIRGDAPPYPSKPSGKS